MVGPTGFPKYRRLLTSKDFNFSKSCSRIKKGAGFKLIYKSSTLSGAKSRLGMAVSSKIGNAVKRNKIKRITREEFRKTEFVESLDILFIPNKDLVIDCLSTELKTVFGYLKGI